LTSLHSSSLLCVSFDFPPPPLQGQSGGHINKLSLSPRLEVRWNFNAASVKGRRGGRRRARERAKKTEKEGDGGGGAMGERGERKRKRDLPVRWRGLIFKYTLAPCVNPHSNVHSGVTVEIERQRERERGREGERERERERSCQSKSWSNYTRTPLGLMGAARSSARRLWLLRGGLLWNPLLPLLPAPGERDVNDR